MKTFLSVLFIMEGLFMSNPSFADGNSVISVIHIHRSASSEFETFVERMESRLGTHDASAYQTLVSDPANTAKVESILKTQEGSSGLMKFAVYEHGNLLTIKKGAPVKAKQYVIGNPLIAATMTEHDVRAALYAPVRLLVYQTKRGQVEIEYDLPSSLFGQFKNAKIDAVAKALDAKLEKLIGDSILK